MLFRSDITSKILDVKKGNTKLEESIDLINSGNFDLNVKIDYLKENNIIEIIELLKKNTMPEILEKIELGMISRLDEYKNNIFSEAEKKFVEFKISNDENIINLTKKYEDMNDRINKLFITTQVLNEKLLCLETMISKNIELNSKKIYSKINRNTTELRNSINFIRVEIDTYLDKTYMLVGFDPNNGFPLYVTRKNEYGEIPVRKELADYWSMTNPNT